MVKNAIEYIIKSLVSKPESVVLQENREGTTYTLLVTSDASDVGQIIGKDGKTVRALRTLVNLFGPEGCEKTLDIKQ
jgi:uncharacterized protein